LKKVPWNDFLLVPLSEEGIQVLAKKIGKHFQIFGQIVWYSEIHIALQLTKGVFGVQPETH
jgi:hypothetical protein